MSQARLVVTAVLIEKRSKAEVARTYGISRTWVHELVRRYQTEGDAGLEPRSRRPRSNPNRTSHAVEDEIVILRKDLVDQGLDAGAAAIAAHLHRRHGSSPSVATIWRILVRRGFVTPQTPKIVADPVRSRPTQQTLAGDITHWQLADGTTIEILKSSTTTPDSPSPATRCRSTRPPTSSTCSTTHSPATGCPPAC